MHLLPSECLEHGSFILTLAFFRGNLPSSLHLLQLPRRTDSRTAVAEFQTQADILRSVGTTLVGCCKLPCTYLSAKALLSLGVVRGLMAKVKSPPALLSGRLWKPNLSNLLICFWSSSPPSGHCSLPLFGCELHQPKVACCKSAGKYPSNGYLPGETLGDRVACSSAQGTLGFLLVVR